MKRTTISVYFSLQVILLTSFCRAQDIPDYFGVFAVKRGGEVVELTPNDYGLLKLVKPGESSRSITDFLNLPTHAFTTQDIPAELKFSDIDYFVFQFDQGIGDHNCSLYLYTDMKNLADWGVLDRSGPQSTPDVPTYVEVKSLGVRDGLRMSKLGPNKYKLSIPDDAARERINALFTSVKTGVPEENYNVISLWYGKKVYQFKIAY